MNTTANFTRMLDKNHSLNDQELQATIGIEVSSVWNDLLDYLLGGYR